MKIPPPRPGLVFRYGYLWRREAEQGEDAGRKDRPCVIVLAVQIVDNETVVTVAPITHTPPSDPKDAIEIPTGVKTRLGLDDARSWIVVTEMNRFSWPGFDLSPIRRGADTPEYGPLPRMLYRKMRDAIIAAARAGRLRITGRG